jgi:hypothetical protein
MKVYIAAPYGQIEVAGFIAEEIESHGHQVISTWLKLPAADDSDARARICLGDVAKAEIVVALEPPTWRQLGRGGRHVELGFALALGIPVLLVGERLHVFHHLENVAVVDWASAGLVDFPIGPVLGALEVLRAGSIVKHALPALELWVETAPFSQPEPVRLRDLNGWELADGATLRVGKPAPAATPGRAAARPGGA